MILIMIYLFNAELTVGTIKYIHMFETCVDSAAGFAFAVRFISMIAATFFSQFLIKKFGTIGMFGCFTCFIFASCLYVLIFVKDTTYKFINQL